jgi:hypothetical protein
MSVVGGQSRHPPARPRLPLMTPTDIAATSFWPNVARRVPSSASFEEAWDRVVFLSKLLFETGRAEVSVTAEWAAQILSADTAFS